MNIATTMKAREKYAQYLAGETTLAEATNIAFGNDGAEADGTPKEIDLTWTSVPGELLSKSLTTIASNNYTTEMLGELLQDELNGEEISAAGIYDADNDLIAVATFNPIPKTDDDKLEFNWNTVF